jgi:hypothetical protein
MMLVLELNLGVRFMVQGSIVGILHWQDKLEIRQHLVNRELQSGSSH